MLPKDWDLSELENYIERNREKSDPSKKTSINKLCIELEHLSQETGALLGTVESKNQLSIKNVFNKGEVLFGKLRPYLKKYYRPNFDGVCSSEIWVLRGKKDKCNNDFLFQLVQTHKFIETCNKTTGSKMPRADWEIISKDLFLFPPINEQNQIAEILTTCDSAIEKTTQLIAAKEKRKKALMQNLLTGKVRFKEFEGEEWEELPLSFLANVKGGKRLPKGYNLINENTGFPYLRVSDMYMGGIKTNEILYIPKEVQPSIKNYTISSNDLFISVAGTLGLVGKVPQSFNNANLTENADKICEIKCNKDYLMYYLMSEMVQCSIQESSTNNAQPKLALEQIRNFKIEIPNNKKEQEKIAKVLSDADEEIQKLKQQLAKLKAQKKGLMQVLLTGKVRVKI